ncbi:MAG: aromatic amino acid transport family protein [Candidatus Paceibacterota bacterium]
MFKNIILPASLLAGTIIGAGIFALPYIFEKAGILTGLFYLIIFSGVFALIHLMYADIIVRTKENHRFPGYAGIYLGKAGEGLAILITIAGMIFALTTYLVLSVSFFNLIFSGIILLDIYKILIFWLLSSLAIFIGVNRLALSEFLIVVGIAAVIFVVLCYGLANFERVISAPLLNLSYVFLPYGAILFSFSGRTAIPTVVGYFRKNNQPQIKSKTPIILGSLIPALIYLVFIFGIISLSGTVSEDSVSGLIGHLPPFVLLLLGILGIISLFSSHIMIGRNAKKSLEHDLGFPQILAGLVVVVFPLLLYLLGFQNFLELVGLVGGIFVGLAGIFIILMWLKARKTEAGRGVIIKKINPLVIYGLLLVFIGGVIYAIIQ